MATFKVGQRVRIVITNPYAMGSELNGTETVISAEFFYACGERCWPTQASDKAMLDPFCLRGVIEGCLVPLTPPAADTWAADKVKELLKPKPLDLERNTEEMERGAVHQ